MSEGETQRRSITPAELAITFEGPAIHSNKMYISNVGAGVRLTFAEQHGELVPPQFRAAVLLSFPDAVSLRDLLSRQLKQFEAIQHVELDFGPDGKPFIKNG